MGLRFLLLVTVLGLGAPAAAATAGALSAAQRAKRIDLDVRDADVHDVLRLLADTARVNLVVAPGVEARVTLRLRDVRWDAAFRAVLTLTGLGAESRDGIVLVDRLERIDRRRALELERRALGRDAAPLVTRIIPVRYARARELQPLVASMLSPRGRVQVDERTNTLIVTDVQSRLDPIERHWRER